MTPVTRPGPATVAHDPPPAYEVSGLPICAGFIPRALERFRREVKGTQTNTGFHGSVNA